MAPSPSAVPDAAPADRTALRTHQYLAFRLSSRTRIRLATVGVVTLVLLAVVGLTLGAVGVASAAGAADAVGVADTDGDDGPEFETAFVSVETNETTAIEMTANEPFTLLIGDEDDAGYELRATVTPSEDGSATVAFDHGDAGDGVGSDEEDEGGHGPLSATGAEDVTVSEETTLDTALDAGDYEMALFVDADGDHDADDPHDLGTLVVEATGDEDGDGDGDTETQTATPDHEPTPIPEEDADEVDLVVEPNGERELAVPVDLDDDETLALRVRSAPGVSPGFVETADAVVEDGEAVATFDFDDGALEAASHGDEATVHPRDHEDAELESFDVLFVNEEVGVTAADGAATDTEEDADDDTPENVGEDTPEETDGMDDDDAGLDEEAPGFGIVAALASLLGAVLVAVVGRSRK